LAVATLGVDCCIKRFYYIKRCDSIEVSLIKIIDEKLNTNIKNKNNILSSYASIITEDGKDSRKPSQKAKQYNGSPAIVEDFRSLMMSTRNEELAEEKDKKGRVCNIIIHGKGES